MDLSIMTKKEKIQTLEKEIAELSKRVLCLEVQLKAIEDYNSEITQKYKDIFAEADEYMANQKVKIDGKTVQAEQEEKTYIQDVKNMFSFE